MRSPRAARAASATRVTALALLTIGCGSTALPPVEVLPPPTPEGRARLEALRATTAVAATRRIALQLREPRSGRVLSARGAVAVAPPRALRMILLGPGGTTALDLWIEGGRYRFAVPAIELKKRGDLAGPREERRGLPVDFLASWLLRPAGGELVGYARASDGDHFTLRDDTAEVHLVVRDDGHVEVRRQTWASTSAGAREPLDDETISADRTGCGHARYHQQSTGLDVTVTCESESRDPPPARAFADPDAEEPR